VCEDVNLAMTERQEVEIDYCPECRGVWLDRGELDKIVERTGAEAAQAQPRDKESRHKEYDSRKYSHDSPKHGYHKKKKGGLLKELFDF